MAVQSLFEQAKELGRQAASALSTYDITEMPQSERELIINLKHYLTDVRLDVRDYEYAHTRAEQLEAAKEGREHLSQLQDGIVKASEYNIFSAVDVAHLSARIQQIISGME